MKTWLKQIRLIGIADSSLGAWSEIEAMALAALGAGLPAIMLRDKTETADEALREIWERIAKAARAAEALLIVNRRLELARAIGAGGVHLGKEGPHLEEARGAMIDHPGAIFGYSAHSIGEAMNAFDAGFDYVTFSPIFETPSKSGKLAPIGLDTLREFCKRTPGPVVALGGIDAGNLAETMLAGAAGAAMIRGLFRNDPRLGARSFLASIQNADDLKAFEQRRREPTIPLEAYVKELERRGKL